MVQFKCNYPSICISQIPLNDCLGCKNNGDYDSNVIWEIDCNNDKVVIKCPYSEVIS